MRIDSCKKCGIEMKEYGYSEKCQTCGKEFTQFVCTKCDMLTEPQYHIHKSQDALTIVI